MNNTPTNDSELDGPFLKKFRELKQQRNNHLIDEPDFDDAVEQLAADIYAHPTRDGWCCACDADIAFAAQDIQQEPEFQALLIKRALEELELALSKSNTAWVERGDLKSHEDFVHANILRTRKTELQAQLKEMEQNNG